MPERPEFIQLEPDDDVASVRDRLSFFRGQRVLLIWPEAGTVLTRKLDLVLVQREAMRRSIRLALVTHDRPTIQHAQELNISTFETIGSSERTRWKRGRSKVFANRWQRPETITGDADELRPVASRVRGDGASSRWRLPLRIAVVLLLLMAVAALALVVIPGAVVRVQVTQDEVTVTVPITTDVNATDINIEDGIIPATILRVTIEETGTLPTTGEQALADVLAQGSVVFVNQTESTVTIPAGTTVSTSTGSPVLFRTLTDGSLPAGSGQQLELPIEALQASAGTVGNVDTGLINTVVGPLAEQVTVRNLNPTTGGMSRTLAAVTTEDRDRLLAMVRQQLQSRAFVEMEPRLDANQFVIPESVRIAEERSDWTTFNAQPGDAAEELTLTMRAVVEAIAVNEQFAQQIALARLSQQIPRGREIRQGSLLYERGPIEALNADGQASFMLTGSGLVAGQVDSNQLQAALAGLLLADAQNLLSVQLELADASPPEIVLSPDWFGRMPLLPVRIEIEIVEP